MAPRRAAVVRDGVLTLAQVADLSVLPDRLRGRAAALVLVRFEGGRMPSSLPLQALFDRARGVMPVLAGWLPRRVAGSLELRSAALPAAAERVPAGDCLRAVARVAAGSRPHAADFVPVPCGPVRPQRAFAYDRAAQSVRTTRPLAPGDTVLRYAGFGEARVVAGDRLTLRVRSGPVRIERPVEALQDAGAGKRIFVRTAEGDALVAAVEGDPR